ncbi:MAG: hypothetical protein FWE40_03190 [Oscillospiraceae bacterium]|nr:hypothetical protein [Oscillospiraceae bacterium]
MKKFAVLLLVLALLFAGTLVVHADDWAAPVSFTVRSQDGTRQFDFALISESLVEYPWHAMSAEIILLEGEEVVLWSNDFRTQAYEDQFVFSANLNTFAFFSPVGENDVALELWTDGQLVRTYMVDELVQDMSMVMGTISRMWWEDTQARVFDPATNLLTVVTVDGITHTFALGEAPAQSVLSWQVLLVIIIGVIVLGVAVLKIVLLRKKEGAHD